MAITGITRWSSVEYLLHIVIFISVIKSVWSQTTCAGRRCKIQLTEGETQVVNFPGSVETVIDSLDEIKWTITAQNDQNRILFVIDDINWPKTDIKFEDQNPNSISIQHEGKVFPVFPEYSTKLITSGIFLSGTHSMTMEMDIPIVAELPSIPSFQMQFTAYSVQELFRCKLSTTSCDTIATAPWRKSSEGYVYTYTGSTTVDEGSLTIRLSQGTQLEGKGYLSFGYVFDYKGVTSGGSSRDEEGRVTVTCPGKRNFGISPNGATQLIVQCDMDDSSITFTVQGSLRLVITDVAIHDASISMPIVDPEPSAESSALPVIAGVFVFVGLLVAGVIALAILRRKRSQSADSSKPNTTVDKGGRDNNGFRTGSVRTFEDPDDGTYHYPSFPLNPPPKDGDTIYQEIEKKDMNGRVANKKGGARDAGKNAYDFLELPGDGSLDSNKKTRSMERLSINGSPLLSRCKNRSMGYETLDGSTKSAEAKDRERKSPSVTPRATPEKKTEYPKQTPEYLEILSESELDALKKEQDKNGQPVLAHQDLYQRLQRKDIQFQKPGTSQVAAMEKRSSVGTDTTEENYGKLDIATDSPPGAPNYFVLESNTDC